MYSDIEWEIIKKMWVSQLNMWQIVKNEQACFLWLHFLSNPRGPIWGYGVFFSNCDLEMICQYVYTHGLNELCSKLDFSSEFVPGPSLHATAKNEITNRTMSLSSKLDGECKNGPFPVDINPTDNWTQVADHHR